jgi:hypothetical protein
MFGISSELASQTISKNMVWDCLVESGKVSGSLTSDILKRMTVEGWAVGVRVVIKRVKIGNETIKGLSTIISPLKIITQFMKKSLEKSYSLHVFQQSERLFLVDSFQNPNNKHVVNAQPHGLTCSCLKFKCLNKRMHKEAPQLINSLSQLISADGTKICVTEIYDHYTKTITEKVHIQCHHIQSVMKQIFHADTSLDYVMNWKQVMKELKVKSYLEKAEEADLFPANWGTFTRKTRYSAST